MANHVKENIEVLEINMDDAMKMIDTGEIKDGKTIHVVAVSETP